MHRPDEDWWRTAAVYQVYPRSFADSDGDGPGSDATVLLSNLEREPGPEWDGVLEPWEVRVLRSDTVTAGVPR